MLTTVSIQLNENGLYPDTVPTYLRIVVEQEAELCVGLLRYQVTEVCVTATTASFQT